jgi:2-polyprenyl-3-methyl-5-hydroxy-6-metoxy-1,4-benzoquinol methylase
MKNKCPICNSTNLEQLYHQDFNNIGISIMKSYDVVRCEHCNFIFADNLPSQGEFNFYYEKMSKWEQVNLDNESENNLKYKKHFEDMLYFILPYSKNRDIKILDIGCSTGGFLNEFKNQGYKNLLGLDPSENCIKITKQLYDINGVANNIFLFNTREYYDLITCSAVLEHIVDVNEFIKKCSSLLAEDGILFIEVPNANKFKDYVYTPFQQFSIEHIQYFTINSLQNLLSKNNFKIIEYKETEHVLNNTIDPSIFVIAKKINKKNIQTIVKDSENIYAIKQYINRSMYEEGIIKERIKNKIKSTEKIIVWGTGTFLLYILKDTFDMSKILYFVDSNIKIQGKEIEGIIIKKPEDIKEDAPIFISSYAFKDEITNIIWNKLKLKNSVITL